MACTTVEENKAKLEFFLKKTYWGRENIQGFFLCEGALPNAISCLQLEVTQYYFKSLEFCQV